MMNRIVYLFALTILYSCANIKPLDGGPKDVTPPSIELAQPENKSTNINPKKVTIYFDEQIKEGDIKSNLIINPYIDNPYKYKVRRNRLEIEFEKTFKDSTTYTISLNKCIKDITENNETKDIKYIFSTGNYIDTLKQKVIVENIYDQKKSKEILVGLYQLKDTNTVLNTKPLYYTYTNEIGVAELSYLKEDQYEVYIFDDKNKNLLYDIDETIGFIDSKINVDSNSNEIKIHPIIKNQIKKNEINNIVNYSNTYQITFFNETKKAVLLDSNYTKINIKSWFTDYYTYNIVNLDSYFIGYIYTESIDNQIDTIEFRPKKVQKVDYLSLRNKKLKLKPEQNIEVTLSNIPDLIVDSLLYFVSDSNKIKNNGWKLDSNSNILEIFPPKHLIKYELHVDSNSIQSNGIGCKEFVKTYKTLEIENTGIIKGKINCSDTNNILQLLNTSYKIIEEKFNINKEYSFRYIDPGTYKIRLIIDTNKNGKWDNGDFEKRNLPEEIFFHKSDIIVKENWEINDINIICE